MKIGFGLYNHMLNDAYYKLAKQLGASHIVAHLTDYFHQSETGSKDQPLGERNKPDAIANVFVYLCSSLANELDGHALLVDNGVGLPKLG